MGHFVLVTDGGPWLQEPRVVWARLPLVTPEWASHRPYQIVESEKILSRMIFQSQLWLLLLLSFWDYGHRVMTLCHQLFCRKIFHRGENEGGQQSLGSNLSTSQFELGIDCHLLVSERQQSMPCFISEMSVGCVMRVTWSSLTHDWLGVTQPISILMFGPKYSSLVSISQSRSSQNQIPW